MSKSDETPFLEANDPELRQLLIESVEVLTGVSDINLRIDKLLDKAIAFYDSDRAYVIEGDTELVTGINTHERCAEGIESQQDTLKDMPPDVYTHWLGIFHRFENIVITDMRDVMKVRPNEYKYFNDSGVHSIIVVPFSKRLSQGFVGVDNPRRHVRDALPLRVLSYAVVLELNELKLTREKNALMQVSQYPEDSAYVHEVKVFNLVDPKHGDSWNCMSDLNGDTLLAQVLTNVIISNTSEGKGDHFWDNGEANLLKALVLYIDLDRSRSPETKNLAAAYQLLTQHSERQLTALFEKLPLDHPARAPFNLFSQASDTVRSGIVLGLGTRLQVLQNEAVRNIISRSDIDLTAPGKRKCAYFVILSDQDATMAFLSSLFFSFLFIKLVRYADSTPELRCKVPVNLIFDEFNNVGKLGGAADGSDFARTLSVIRSRAIYVMLAVQSLGQLQNRYPNNLWAEIIGNLDIQLMLGCTDEVSAEYFSARSGDMSVEINSTMTVRKTIAVAQVIPQYRQTEGQGRRRLLTPDEVLRIPNEELLVVIRGHNILKLKKFDYTDHPLSKELTPVSILDYAPLHIDAPFSQTETVTSPTAQEENSHTSPKSSKHKTLYSSAKPPSEF